MSANIFGSRFLGVRAPAWHGLGTIIEEPITAVDAVKMIDADFNVVKLPFFVKTPDGKSMPINSKVAIMREPTSDDPNYVYFGEASADYGLVQNVELAEMLDGLTKEWPVETVGVLGSGETMFMTLRVGRTKVHKEDELEQFFLVTDTKDGGTALRIAFTPVRVVCQNTLISGLASASVSSALTHHMAIKNEVDFRVRLIGRLQSAQLATMEAFEAMANAILKPQQIFDVVTAAYPMPKRPQKAMLLDEIPEGEADFEALYAELTMVQELWEYHCGRAEVFREGALELLDKFNSDFPSMANTGWAAYNAVVECEDYRDGGESTLISTLWGQRASTKKRAFNAVMHAMAIKG